MRKKNYTVLPPDKDPKVLGIFTKDKSFYNTFFPLLLIITLQQPWRVIFCGDAVHFYLKRSKGFMYDERLDMQMIDMGIALCHFELGAKEAGVNVQFEISDPELTSDMEYVASYKII